jgi:hypothetical protein
MMMGRTEKSCILYKRKVPFQVGEFTAEGVCHQELEVCHIVGLGTDHGILTPILRYPKKILDILGQTLYFRIYCIAAWILLQPLFSKTM